MKLERPTPETVVKSTLNVPILAQGMVALAVLLWTASHLFPPINLDVGALLYVAKRWLAGDRLYVDVIDVNTPWAIGLHVPAEFTASQLGLDGPTWFSLYVVLSILVAVHLVWRLTQEHALELGSLTARTLPLITFFVLGVDPGRGFGQREHLLMIAVAPYMVLSALRASDTRVRLWRRVTIAFIAGLGFAIKPHFLLPLVLVELYLLYARGWKASVRDPVPWTIAAVQVVHLLFTLLVVPEYVSVVLPFAGSVYASPTEAFSQAIRVLAGPELGPVVALLPITAIIAFGLRVPLARLLCLFVAGAATSAAIQGKGWDYHSIPALDAMLLLSVVIVTQLIERHMVTSDALSSDGCRVVAACLIVPFLFLDGLRLQPFREQLQFPRSQVHDWLQVMERERHNERALVLSAGMYPQFPAMNYADFKMAMPFLTMWPLHGLYGTCRARERGYRPIDQQPEQEAFFFRGVVEGFVEERPDLLVVDKFAGMNDCSGKPFEYLSYFLRDARFARAFRDYRPLANLGQYAFYERITNVLTAVPPPHSGRATSPHPEVPAKAKAPGASQRPLPQ